MPLRLTRLVLALLLGVIAFTLVIVITEDPGPGLDPDAQAYLGAAESLALKGTYWIPSAKWRSADSTEALAHFPPGYSTVLALPIRLGMAPPQGARLIQAVAAFISVAVLVLLVSSATSLVAGALLPMALFAMTSMHELYVSVLSEPLFFACLIVALAAMVWWPDRPLRAGLPAAAGVMTRYAGAAVVAALAVWMLMQPGTWLVRLRRAAIAIAPSALLEVAWIVRTRLAAGPGEIREFAVYGNVGPTLCQGLATLIAWLAPDIPGAPSPMAHRGLIALTGAIALLALVTMGAARARRDAEREPFAWRIVTASALIIVCYLIVVAASRLLADPDIPLDERMMSPVLLLLATSIATLLGVWWRSAPHRVARVAVLVMLVAWWLAAARATRAKAHYALTWGSDFAGQQWRTSEVLSWARTEGASAPLYSSWPAAVYFHLHRPARELPRRSDASTITAFADTVRARRGYVLLFGIPNRLYAPKDSLLKTRRFEILEELSDGWILVPRIMKGSLRN